MHTLSYSHTYSLLPSCVRMLCRADSSNPTWSVRLSLAFHAPRSFAFHLLPLRRLSSALYHPLTRQVSATRPRNHTSHDSHHTYPHSCSTCRCHSRHHRCALQRIVNFLLRRPFLDFITPHLHRSCSDADAEHIVVISMRHRTYTCNSVLDAALLSTLERRLENFPVFSLLFSPLHLLTTRSILQRSR
jgi:hypothetical protein